MGKRAPKLNLLLCLDSETSCAFIGPSASENAIPGAPEHSACALSHAQKRTGDVRGTVDHGNCVDIPRKLVCVGQALLGF